LFSHGVLGSAGLIWECGHPGRTLGGHGKLQSWGAAAVLCQVSSVL